MSSHFTMKIGIVLILGTLLIACRADTPFDIAVEEFGVDSLPLPNNWDKRLQVHSSKRMQELGASDSLEQTWEPKGDAQSVRWTIFFFDVYKFESIVAAEKGYNQAINLFRRPGYNMEPLPEWAYRSSFADQYRMFCSYPETTPASCFSVGRYSNFVTIAGLAPGDGVTLKQTPELLSTADQHMQAVIKKVRQK